MAVAMIEAAAAQVALEAQAALDAQQIAESAQSLPSASSGADSAVDGVPAVWQCIHEHEQPDWHAPGRYPGGLGIMAEATDNYREQIDPSFPVPSESATPAQQVKVAEWVLGYAGADAWATAGVCGL